jgi:hypothetical protein
MRRLFSTIILIILLTLVGLTSIVIASDMSNETKLITGKNNITTFESFKPIYVKDFVKKYPNIIAISYREEQFSKDYLNYLGGLGDNFILMPNKQYEIITSKDISISLK